MTSNKALAHLHLIENGLAVWAKKKKMFERTKVENDMWKLGPRDKGLKDGILALKLEKKQKNNKQPNKWTTE